MASKLCNAREIHGIIKCEIKFLTRIKKLGSHLPSTITVTVIRTLLIIAFPDILMFINGIA